CMCVMASWFTLIYIYVVFPQVHKIKSAFVDGILSCVNKVRHNMRTHTHSHTLTHTHTHSHTHTPTHPTHTHTHTLTHTHTHSHTHTHTHHTHTQIKVSSACNFIRCPPINVAVKALF